MGRIAKDIVSVAMLLHCAATGHSQGLIQFGNSFGSGATGFRAPIFGFDSSNPTLSQVGNPPSPLGNPGGTTVYAGPLLHGTGYTIALFAGLAGTSESELMLVMATTFRTASGNVLPAGLISTTTVAVNGVWPGQTATLQIRVWDNKGGTITSWAQVLALDQQDIGDRTAHGSSSLFQSYLGALWPPTLPVPPATVGWESFNIYIVPEPSVIALGLLGCAALTVRCLRRFRA